MARITAEQVYELLGELRKDVRDIRDQHGAKLSDIEVQTTKTNGSVAECMRRLHGHDIEFRDVKASIQNIERRSAPPAAAVVGADPKASDAIRLEIPRAVYAKAGALVGTLAVFMPPIVAWAKEIVLGALHYWAGTQ